MLVTGGARGLGADIARAASDAGYRVGVIDVAFDISANGSSSGVPEHQRFETSVVDTAQVEAVFEEFGIPDVVVNNAGIVRFGPLVDQSVESFREVIDVNLIGTFLVAATAARRWIASGTAGVVVNLTSMNGVAAGPNAGAYGATKAGVVLLTSQMAIEWGPHNIRVNSVAPGLIDAGMSQPIYADEATRRARQSKVPLGRLGTARDISDAVLFLASDQASYIHGQNLVVDGGVTGSVIAHLPRPESVDSIGHGT